MINKIKSCEICGTTKGKIVGKNGKYKMDLCNRHYLQQGTYGSSLDITIFDPNDIVIGNDHAEIILRNRKHVEVGRALIDIDFIAKAKEWKWHLNNHGYVVGSNKGKLVKLHRMVMDCPEGLFVDHIFHNKLDNRKDNLRICTRQENQMNVKVSPINTSGHTGVYWHKRLNKWCVSIRVNNHRHHIGYYVDKQDAIAARKVAEEKYFGDFAYKAI